MKRSAILVFAATLAASPLAHADELTVAASVTLGGASAITFTTIDLTKHPRTKQYAKIELGVAGGFALINGYFAATVRIERQANDIDRAPNLVLGALAAWNLGLAIHGGYLLTRPDKSEKRHKTLTSFSIRGARGTFAPALVSDGVSSGAGAMIGGSF